MGPLTAKSMTTIEIIEEFIKEMKFQVVTKMHYNPHHVISEKRLLSNISTYQDQENQLLEKTSNKFTWDEVK